jgi:hypothetical protein
MECLGAGEQTADIQATVSDRVITKPSTSGQAIRQIELLDRLIGCRRCVNAPSAFSVLSLPLWTPGSEESAYNL